MNSYEHNSKLFVLMQYVSKIHQLMELKTTMSSDTFDSPKLKILNQIDEVLETEVLRFYALSNLDCIYPNFYQKIQAIANNTLTTLDIKHCLLILMGISNSEIADFMDIDIFSVKVAKGRIKKKLRMSNKVDFDGFIEHLYQKNIISKNQFSL